jgi:hypothetical protein
MSFMGKGAPGLKAEREGKDPERLARIHDLQCCICYEFWEPQFSPTQAHHCIHGRHSMGRKAPDCMTIPLCEGHHQGLLDTSKIALHREPKAWREKYGDDTKWISWTNERLYLE